MTNEKSPFILIDGSSYLYRAYHALPPLNNSQGQPTGAIYGVINMIRKLLQTYNPIYIAVIFDAKGKTFRDDIYADYKANRPPMPDDLQLQIKPLHELVDAMGLPLLLIEGYEADDVIGTLAKQATQQSMDTLISTGDKDMAQLVNAHIQLINTMTNTFLDRKNVIEKFGIPPELIIDYLTLIGDTVDNIPGVPKVGPKTAVKWLQEYGSLDHIIKNADKISGKVGENLRSVLDQLPISRQLATIHQDVPLPLKLEELKRKDPDQKRLSILLKTLEFKSWLHELADNIPVEKTKMIAKSYKAICHENELKDYIAQLKNAKLFAFDTETDSLNAIEAKLVGVSFSIKPDEAVYIPFGHDYENAPKQLNADKVLALLKPVLEAPELKKVGHNFKYDLNVLMNHDICLQGIAHDTLLESYVLESTERHDMDSLSLKYLEHKTISFEEVAGKGAQQVTFNKVAVDQATLYAAEDADVTLKLHHLFWASLEKNSSLKKVYEEIEMPLMQVLARMERKGVLINEKLLKKQSATFGERLQKLEQEAFIIAGEVFNMNSPKQLQEILYQKQGLPILEKTPTGQASTSESVLQELAFSYPLPKLILEYRSLSKLKSTYTDKLPEQINSRTGRVHTSYNQAVVATGRLSSTDPNLQNIPARTLEGRQIRAAFIAPKNKKIVSADYSQIELRIMAHFSQDEGLLNAFRQGLDIHQSTASEVFGVPLAEVSSELRRRAKAINFGLIYGMSSFGLAKQLGTEREAAQNYINLYFERYPGVKNYMEKTRAQAHKLGYVETFYGRRLYLPEINAKNMQRRRAAERAAINAPLQGTAADIIKLAMIKVEHWLRTSKFPAEMIMQVHDELIFEVESDQVEKFMPQLRACMCDDFHLTVPFSVEIGTGDNWYEAHE